VNVTSEASKRGTTPRRNGGITEVEIDVVDDE